MYEIPSFHLLRHSQIPRFVDCDMFMHFVGGVIGHKESGHMQQSTHLDVDEDLEEVDADEDSEEVDVEEEADYGYVDNFEIEGEDNDLDLVSEDSENNDNDKYGVL